MKQLSSIFLALTLLALLFVGCAKNGTVGSEIPAVPAETEQLAGFYQAVELGGEDRGLEAGNITMTLSADGTVILSNAGDDLSGTWTRDGDTITVTADGISVSGTVEAGEILLQSENGQSIRFRRAEGSAPAVPAAPTDTQNTQETASAAGLYMIQSLNGETLGHANDITLRLYEDGTALFTAYGEEEEGTWTLDGENITVTISGSPISGTLRNGELYLAQDGNSMQFGYAGNSTTQVEEPTREDFYGEYTLELWNGQTVEQVIHGLAEEAGITDEEALARLDPNASMDRLDDLVTVTFREDGTYTLRTGSETQDGTYVLNDHEIITDPDDYPTYGTWTYPRITMEDDGQSMVFVHR